MKKEEQKEDLNKNKDNHNDMGKRRLINKEYYEVRERSTSAGQKGTIKGKWKPKPPKKGFWDKFFGE